ncbi:MAG: SLC13 family permease [Geminicoccaceae bacterium]|nr:SLC13 family permease [Geminicoccaceae bacterium]MCS7268498.1 SLC13 family permease [Geminicoccaceae bacterium]MCX8102490.1 SLC13 family permease [Geminicoccaceae bacterium]MDW8124388.1 SLC13 family permease [Geminicoccaceae bacterium]MDW8340840.1 SLC13 family permease [Geminicoccaceae bacterium]
MTTPQLLLFLLLAAALALFVWGRWRHDVVALSALSLGVLLGLVPARDAFAGFADPAVITVACVLVLSRAIRDSGLLDRLLEPFSTRIATTTRQVLVLGGLTGFLSMFMNNVGAVALVMPAAIRLARRTGTSPAHLLMPLAAMSLLGGLVTLIGTPPNLLVSALRREQVGSDYAMFDFAPIGLPLTLTGLLYLAVGWRLLPRRRGVHDDEEPPFRIEDYIVEVRVTEGSPFRGRSIGDLETALEGRLRVLALLRQDRPRNIATGFRRLFPGDVLQVEVEPAQLRELLAKAGLELAGRAGSESAKGLSVVEAVVTAGSPLVGRTAAEFALRERYGMNLLAIRRGGDPPQARLALVPIQAGDTLMLEGPPERMIEQLVELGCLPIVDRGLRLERPEVAWRPALLMLAAVALVTFGLLPAAIAFTLGVLALLLSGAMKPDAAYRAIDWSVIVLLGAFMPVADALATTGAADLLAGLLARATAGADPIWALAVVLLATMAITPILNNAATVLLVGPVAVAYAKGAGLSVDPFLMAVAIGASCDFLTPVGHQSNTLVLGPGGYRFGDYARLGFPLTLLTFVLSLALLPRVWPLSPAS